MIKPLLLVAVLALTACASYTPSTAPTHAPDGVAFAQRDLESPIDNFAKIDDKVARGATPDSASGMGYLKSHGYRTIIDLRDDTDDVKVEKKEAAEVGINVINIPMHAGITSDPPTEEQVRMFFRIVSNANRQPVYIHCQYGKDRTGTMCALYRIQFDHWSNEDAVAEMEAFGYHDWYQDLIQYVRDYKRRGKNAKQ